MLKWKCDMLTCAGFVEMLVRLEDVDGLEEAEALGHARRRAVAAFRCRVVTGAEDGAAEEVVLVEEDVVAGRRGLLAGADLLHRPYAPPALPQSGGAPHAVLDLRCRIAIVITGGVITSNQHSIPPTGQASFPWHSVISYLVLTHFLERLELKELKDTWLFH